MTEEQKPTTEPAAEKPPKQAAILPGLMLPATQRPGLVIRTVPELITTAKWCAGSGLAGGKNRSAEEAFYIMGRGLAMGLDPFAALDMLTVINGRLTVYSECALALCRQGKIMVEFKEWYSGDPEGEDFTAHCYSRRTDQTEGVETVFSRSDAETAGLMGGQNYVGYLQRMLKHRARSWNLHDQFPEVLAGLPTTEDWQNQPPVRATDAPQLPAREERMNQPAPGPNEAPDVPMMSQAAPEGVESPPDEPEKHIIEFLTGPVADLGLSADQLDLLIERIAVEIDPDDEMGLGNIDKWSSQITILATDLLKAKGLAYFMPELAPPTDPLEIDGIQEGVPDLNGQKTMFEDSTDEQDKQNAGAQS